MLGAILPRRMLDGLEGAVEAAAQRHAVVLASGPTIHSSYANL